MSTKLMCWIIFFVELRHDFKHRFEQLQQANHFPSHSVAGSRLYS